MLVFCQNIPEIIVRISQKRLDIEHLIQPITGSFGAEGFFGGTVCPPWPNPKRSQSIKYSKNCQLPQPCHPPYRVMELSEFSNILQAWGFEHHSI